jgi:gamma-glutamyltranspeptidase
MKRDHLSVAFGVMGGWNHPQAHLHVISNIVDHGLNNPAGARGVALRQVDFPAPT